MERIQRPISVLAWLGVVLVIGRILSGGGTDLGSVLYALGVLPPLITGWLVATGLVAFATVVALIAGGVAWRGAYVIAMLAVPLGVVLKLLDHDSGLAVTALATLIVVWPFPRHIREAGLRLAAWARLRRDGSRQSSTTADEREGRV